MAGREAMAPSLREARELIVAGHYREARAVLHRLSLVSLRLQDESAVAELERVIRVLAVNVVRGAEAVTELAAAWGARDQDAGPDHSGRRPRSRLRFGHGRAGAPDSSRP